MLIRINYSTSKRRVLTTIVCFQGVVVGILLVTPNCVMFDPNVSDPLVLEHGVDRYGVIVPMDNVVTAAIYRDIAHMRVKDRGAPALLVLTTANHLLSNSSVH